MLGALLNPVQGQPLLLYWEVTVSFSLSNLLLGLFFFFLRFYLLIFREGEGGKHQCMLASHAPTTPGAQQPRHVP